MIDLKNSTYNTGWYSVGLPNRTCGGTYCYFPLDSLPPIDQSILKGSFGWLTELSPDLKKEMEVQHQVSDKKNLENLKELEKNIESKNLSLPTTFLKIMQSPRLQKEIPSCTASYFSIHPEVFKSPVSSDEGYFVSFYRDQQDVLIWYLYLLPSGEHAIFCSGIDLDLWVSGYYEDEFEKGTTKEEKEKIFCKNMLCCSPHLEAFLYRWYIENSIWFTVNDYDSDSPEPKYNSAQIAYLKHYEKSK